MQNSSNYVLALTLIVLLLISRNKFNSIYIMKLLINQMPEDPMLSYLNHVLYKKQPIIVIPRSFFVAIKNYANRDISNIEKYAKEVVRISVRYRLNLNSYEKYFQLRLDSHLDRQPVMISSLQMVISLFLAAAVFLFLVPELDLLKFLSGLAGISAIFFLILKPLYMDKISHSTRAYRYCILILKRADELKLN